MPVAAPAPSGAYASRRVTATPAPASELTNVIVFVKDAPKPASLAPMRASIVQQNETFVPRVVAITKGSRVDFPNAVSAWHERIGESTQQGRLGCSLVPLGANPRTPTRRASPPAAIPRG
jgi:hypothetical protein